MAERTAAPVLVGLDDLQAEFDRVMSQLQCEPWLRGELAPITPEDAARALARHSGGRLALQAAALRQQFPRDRRGWCELGQFATALTAATLLAGWGHGWAVGTPLEWGFAFAVAAWAFWLLGGE